MTGDLFINGKSVGEVKDITWNFNNQSTDHTIFGTQSKTYTIEMSMPLVEPKIVKPEEKGIHLPLIKYLGLGGCPDTKETFAYTLHGNGILAHAHVTPDDKHHGMICMNEEHLKNSDGTYSDILLHELAHLSTDYSKYFTKRYEKLTYWWHGVEWQEWAQKLGIPTSGYATRLPY